MTPLAEVHSFSEEARLGALALGMFVGFSLSFGLMRSKPTVRAAVIAVGAAVGATPLMFLNLMGGLWLYPIGLLLGLMSFRVVEARNTIEEKIARPSMQNRMRGFWAWLDLFIIGAIFVAGVVYAIRSK